MKEGKRPPWAEVCRRARAVTNLTQVGFSGLIGSSRGSIAAWEAGLKKPSRPILSLMASIIAAGGGDWLIAALRSCQRRFGRGGAK